MQYSRIFPQKTKITASNLFKNLRRKTVTIPAALEKAPAADCFVPASVHSQKVNLINIQDLLNDLRSHLESLPQENGLGLAFKPNQVDEIMGEIKYPSQLSLVDKLVQIKIKMGHRGFHHSFIKSMLLASNTAEQAELAEKLLQMEDGSGKLRLAWNDIHKIVKSADTPQKAQYKSDLSSNKDFLSKIDSLDGVFGTRLYALALRSNKSIDVDRMNNLYKYFSENRHMLDAYGQSATNDKDIADLFNEDLIAAADFIDNEVLKCAIKLKKDGVKYFVLDVAKTMKFLGDEGLDKLKDKFSQISRPELIFDKLQCLIPLAKAGDKPIMMDAIDLIKSPKATKSQMDLANSIFTSAKPYEEQVEEFLTTFNVSKTKRADMQEYLLKNKFNESLMQQESVEVALANLERRILGVQKNTQMPEEKKTQVLVELEKQKAELEANSKNTFIPKLSEKAKKLLAQQIEIHINTFNINAEFNKFLKDRIFEYMQLEKTPELLRAFDFDQKYLPSLYRAIFEEKFLIEFKKLVNLVKANPEKPFSELRATLKHNRQTETMFEQRGLNYNKWSSFDPDSFHLFSLSSNEHFKRDLKIRLSDVDDIKRNLFIGNHVGCCTAVDGCNSYAAPQRLMNSFSRMMEIVDKNNVSYGKTMCYFAEVNGKLSFILDCIETKGLEHDKSVTDAIYDYAKKVTKEMAKSDNLADIPVYVGNVDNKVNLDNAVLKYDSFKINIIGRVDSNTYAIAPAGPAKTGYIDVNDPHTVFGLYELGK